MTRSEGHEMGVGWGWERGKGQVGVSGDGRRGGWAQLGSAQALGLNPALLFPSFVSHSRWASVSSSVRWENDGVGKGDDQSM